LSRKCGILNITQACRPLQPAAGIALYIHLFRGEGEGRLKGATYTVEENVK
jgi:hypothetical protein